MIIQDTSLTRRGFARGAGMAAAAMAVPRITYAAGDTKVLRIRTYTDMKTLEPGDAAFDDMTVMLPIFNSPIRYKVGEDVRDWEFVPDIAEELEWVDNTHCKFRLKSGIAWTNGFGELTAEDLKFSYERIANPENNFAYVSDWDSLDRIELADSHSGVIVLKEPNVLVKSLTLGLGRAIIVCKAAVEQAGGRFTTDPIATSGPYQIRSWTPSQQVILERNPLWSGDRPDFDEIHLIPIPDANTASLAFDAGEVDITNIGESLAADYRDNPKEGTRLQIRELVGIEWLGINVDHPQFQDQRVRRAVQLAVDVEQILEGTFLGLAPRANGLVSTGLVGHRDGNLYPARDVAQARELLAEAGFPDGFKTTLTSQNTANYLARAQIIQANLAEVGIDVEILGYESGTFWSIGMEAESDKWQDVALIVNGWTYGPDAIEALRWHRPEQIGIWNWERFNSQEFEDLYQQSIVEFDDSKRHEIMVRMQDLMEESGAYTFFAHGVVANVYSDHIVPALTPDGSRMHAHLFKLRT